MPTKFVSFVFYEGRILGFTEDGNVYKYYPENQEWSFECYGPLTHKPTKG